MNTGKLTTPASINFATRSYPSDETATDAQALKHQNLPPGNRSPAPPLEMIRSK